MRAARDLAIVTALMALGTWLLGWWTVPIVGAGFALLDRRRSGSVAICAVAGLLAWAILLPIQDVFGSSVTQLGRDLGVSLGVPPVLPLVLTLVLPVLLAASAAGTVVGLKRLRVKPPVAGTP